MINVMENRRNLTLAIRIQWRNDARRSSSLEDVLTLHVWRSVVERTAFNKYRFQVIALLT